VSASYAAQSFVRTETSCIFTMMAVLHAALTKIVAHRVEESFVEPVREILLMLILRKRAADKIRRSLDRSVIPRSRADYMDGQFEEADVAVKLARNIYELSRGSAPQVEEERKRVVSLSAERNEFVTFSDGFVHYWPAGSPNGALSSWHLRVLADELDRRNRAWDARVRKALQSADEP
jgi:hypothetical protein